MKTLVAAVASVAILSSFVTMGTMQLIEMQKATISENVTIIGKPSAITAGRLKAACDQLRLIEPNKYSDGYFKTVRNCYNFGYWSYSEMTDFMNASQ